MASDSSLPMFDTRPGQPLFGPLSMWLTGQNPLDPEERPERLSDLAVALGVEPKRLYTIKASNEFRKFHAGHTSALDEVVLRRQEVLNRLFESGMSGSVQALTAYLTHTRNAEQYASTGRRGAETFSVDDAAALTDEDLDALRSGL